MLFPIFVVVTLAEIYVLVSVGQAIGGLSTVLLVDNYCIYWIKPSETAGLVYYGKSSAKHGRRKNACNGNDRGCCDFSFWNPLAYPWLFDRWSRTARTHAMEQSITLSITFLKRMQSASLDQETQYLFIDQDKQIQKIKKMKPSKASFGKINKLNTFNRI